MADSADMQARDVPPETLPGSDRQEFFEELLKYAKALSVVYRLHHDSDKELSESFRQLVKYAGALTDTVKELKKTNQALRDSYLDTIHRLVITAEFKDINTGRHLERLTRYAQIIVHILALPQQEAHNIVMGTPMHDIGKVGIPDHILAKPDNLSPGEFEIMKTHTTIGADILGGSPASMLQTAREIALSHHERWDGSGYPYGFLGESTPLAGRIVGLVDVFDALVSSRPYKEPYPLDTAAEIIEKGRGTQFDPMLVEVFLDNFDVIAFAHQELTEAEYYPGDSGVETAGYTWN